MNQREFKHTSGPWRASRGNIGNLIEGYSGRKLYDHDDGYRAVATYQPSCSSSLYVDEEDNQAANARLLTASPDLCALLAEIEAAILPLLPDIDPVIGVRKRVKELLDVIEKGDA